MRAYTIFVQFFYALDYIFDKTNSKELGNYLSGANPFLFKGENSADPSIYDQFEKAYIKEYGVNKINPEEAYLWLTKYVINLKNDNIKKAFEQISLDMWLESLK